MLGDQGDLSGQQHTQTATRKSKDYVSKSEADLKEKDDKTSATDKWHFVLLSPSIMKER